MTSTPSPVSQHTPNPPTRTIPDRLASPASTTWQGLQALSGIAFAVFLLVGFFISGSDTPDYSAPDEDWTRWAVDNASKSRIGAFLTVTAGFVFLHFTSTMRSSLAKAEAAAGGTLQLAAVASAGALVGITGITMAVVTIAATADGSDADPVVTRANASATVGPFLVAAMGFAAFLSAAGLITLRSRVFPRWIGIVALVGGLAYFITFITFFTLVAGPGKDSAYGYGYPVGILALAIWSIATSLVAYRAR